MEESDTTVSSLSPSSSAYGLTSDASDPPLRYTVSTILKVKESLQQQQPPQTLSKSAPCALKTSVSKLSAPTCSGKEKRSNNGVRQRRKKTIQDRARQKPRNDRRLASTSKSGRSCSADELVARGVVAELRPRYSANKMSEAPEPKRTEHVRKVKRRVKVTPNCEDKGEDRSDGAKSEGKNETKKPPSKNAVRRLANGTSVASVQPIICVKVSPSGLSHKMHGDNDHAPTSEISAVSRDTANRRRVGRRKAKCKSGEPINAEARPDEPAPVFTPSSGYARPAPHPTRLTATAVGPTSPLHCAFLSALKECSPRLVAALSATNEAAFLNAMWSCFWRGYRAGFQASVRELEATSGISITSPTACAVAAATHDSAPRAQSERKRQMTKSTQEPSDIGDSRA